MTQKLVIYDPRRGDDYRYPIGGGVWFSSLALDLLVVEFWFGWELRGEAYYEISKRLSGPWEQLLTEATAKTSSLLFFGIEHLTKNVMSASLPDIENAVQYARSVVGYEEVTAENVHNLLSVRDLYQTYEEWTIGGCSGRFDLPGKAKWYKGPEFLNFEFLLRNVDRIGCLLFRSGDAGVDVFVTRLFEGIDKLVAEVLFAAAAPPENTGRASRALDPTSFVKDRAKT